MRVIEKLRKFGQFFFLTVALAGCKLISDPIDRNDVYATCAPGDTVSAELFKRVQRIIKTDRWYFLWIDLDSPEDGIIYANHILACDHDLILKGASGIVPDISTAKGDTLFGFTSSGYKAAKNKLIKPYRDDLPNEVVLNLNVRQNVWNGYQRNPFAIIDSLQLLNNAELVRLYLRTSDSLFFPGKEIYLENFDYYSKIFNKIKIIDLPLSSLHFSRDRDCIYTIENNDTHSEMHVLNKQILDNIIMEIWREINFYKLKNG